MAKTDSKTTAPATDPAAPPPDAYDPQAVEARWQARWAERHTNEPDLDQAERPFYNLMMFPYPSAEGLHVGNMFAFTGSDIFGRFKRLQGYDVFEPIGFDAFGIHSENYAIKLGINPGVLIPQNIVNFRASSAGSAACSTGATSSALPIRRTTSGPSGSSSSSSRRGRPTRRRRRSTGAPDMTVLANEQVINGRCERCDTVVEQRTLEQWFFRITEYADRLLANLDDKSKMDWSDTTTTAQRNWLGRSEGAESSSRSTGDRRDRRGESIRVFTTLADTVYGATFMVLAPEHPLVDRLTRPSQRPEVDAYRKAAASQDLVSRKVGERDKTGVFTGGYAINPANGQADPGLDRRLRLMEYGTGAIMAVPAHDQRDFEFAAKFGLPIVQVVAPADPGSQCPSPRATATPASTPSSRSWTTRPAYWPTPDSSTA